MNELMVFNFMSYEIWHKFLTYKGSHGEIHQDFQPSLIPSAKSRTKGCLDHRFRALTRSLHYPIANSVLAQS